MKVRALILRLLAAISEALGLDSSYLDRIFGKHTQLMDIMYYPPCPKPDITLGTPRHSDARGITVLMQGEVSGLQVVSNGNLTILLLMLIICQVVSNGRFRSVEHRAVTNASAARISIPTFYGPSEDAFIALAASLVDEQHPARYKGYKFGEFMRIFWSQELNNKTVLDHFKIEYAENNGE
eukprot:PITA_07236